jgi:hypothetical protein
MGNISLGRPRGRWKNINIYLKKHGVTWTEFILENGIVAVSCEKYQNEISFTTKSREFFDVPEVLVSQ